MKLFKTVILFAVISLKGFAQENKSTKISFEVDPATFVFKGYSAHLRIQPKNSDHLLVGIGTYAMDLPNAFVNMNQKNKDKGWNVRINQGYSFFGEHHLTEVNKKWFVGTQIGIQEFQLENNHLVGKEKFVNLLSMLYFGYTFKPLKNNFYLKPWAGLGYTSKISGSNKIQSSEYHIVPITMFATLHMGYTF